MRRTQIQLTNEQYQKLQQVAHARGISIAGVIRDAVDRMPTSGEQSTSFDRAIEAIRELKKGSGRRDISRRHDEYLAEDFG